MEKNFWTKLTAHRHAQGEPFFILAPMADVTDMAFRQVILSCGRPDVFYTEFVSCDGLCSEKGRPKLMPHLKFKENERPIVVQFFGSKPENFYKCARLAVELGFDGIDINMGCPERIVEKQGAGAALIKTPELALKIIKETKRGAAGSRADRGDSLPVSVKTRLGYNKIATKEWVSVLLEAELSAIAIHGRTRKEMSSVPAHWDEIGLAKEMAKDTKTLIIGNGDIATYAEGAEKAKKYSLDGIMVGRAIFSNPWFFSAKGKSASGGNPATRTPKEKLELLKKHLALFTELWGTRKNPAPNFSADRHSEKGQVWNGASFDTMKKFFKVYISGWPDAKNLRTRLMTAKNDEEVRKIISESGVDI